jgi:hypothetical protein
MLHGGSESNNTWIDLEVSFESHCSELKVLQLRFMASITNLNHSRSVRWIAAESPTLNRPNIGSIEVYSRGQPKPAYFGEPILALEKQPQKV